MRTPLRVLTLVGATMLVSAGLVQATATAATPQAATTFSIGHSDGGHNFEYRWGCANIAPYNCVRFNGSVVFTVVVSNRPQPIRTITVNYAVDNITAIHGVNYGGPTSGTLTISTSYDRVQLAIPIIDTGSVGAPSKTLRVRLTGSSVPGAGLDSEIGIIKSGGEIPRDCTPSRPDSQSISATCTSRPATSQWRIVAGCMDGFIPWPQLGPTITGSGTSSATCTGTGLPFVYWGFQLLS